MIDVSSDTGTHTCEGLWAIKQLKPKYTPLCWGHLCPGKPPEPHPQIPAVKPCLIPAFWRGLEQILIANLHDNMLRCKIMS